MSGLKKKMSIIASFSKSYRKICKDQKADMGISRWNEVLNDWWLALRFFFDRAFYQGRRDELSRKYENATLQALGNLFGRSATSRQRKLWELYDNGFLTKKNWKKRRNSLRIALEGTYTIDGGESKTGKKGDRLMVQSVLGFICDEKRCSRPRPLNIVRYMVENIKDKKVAALANELDGIYQVGEKIYSLLLRDVVDLFGLSNCLTADDFKCLQAVDTWVEQLANKLGFQGSKTKLAVELAEACRRYEVDPIAFNQGAWYLAAHSFDVLTENIERIRPLK